MAVATRDQHLQVVDGPTYWQQPRHNQHAGHHLTVAQALVRVVDERVLVMRENDTPQLRGSFKHRTSLVRSAGLAVVPMRVVDSKQRLIALAPVGGVSIRIKENDQLA